VVIIIVVLSIVVLFIELYRVQVQVQAYECLDCIAVSCWFDIGHHLSSHPHGGNGNFYLDSFDRVSSYC
jgi:hypothetical protein